MKHKHKANSNLAVAAFCSLAAFTACADVLFAPTAATAQSQYSLRECIYAINGNGLSNGDGAVTAKTGHNAEYNYSEWLSGGTTNTWIAFDLGDETTITGMHVWNLNEKPDNRGTQYYKRGIKTCELRYGDTMPQDGMSYADAGEWGRLAEVLTLACATGTAGYTGEDLKFHVPAKTRYVMLRVLSTYGFDYHTGLAEVRFYRSPGLPVIPVNATAESVYNNTSYPSRAIDGSGLTQAFLRPYTLGATHDNNGSNINVWLSAGKVETWIAFDLGSEKTVTGFHLWNYNTIYKGSSFGYRGVKTTGIYVAESLPENGTSYDTVVGEGTSHVEDMTFAMADGSTTDLGQDYEFATPVRGRYFLFKVTSSHRGNVTDYHTGISEIVFYEQSDAAEVTRLGSGSKTIPGGASVSVAVVDGEGGEAAPIGVAADATGVRTMRGEATGGTPQIALADGKTLAVGSIELPSWSAGLEITGGSLGFLPEMLGWMELAIDADLTVHSDIASGASGLLKTGSGTFIFDGTDSRTGFTRFTGGGFRQTGGSVSWAKAEFADTTAEFAGGTSSISAGLQMTNSTVAVTGSHVAQWNEVSGAGALSITNGGVLAGCLSNRTNDTVTIEIDGGTLASHAEIGSVPLVPQTKEIAIGNGGATFDTSSGNAIVEAALKPATENAAGAIRKTGANTLTLRGRMENRGPVSVEAGTLALRTLPAIHYDFDNIVDGVVPNLGAAGSALDGIMANSKDASKKPEAVEGVSGTALRFNDYDTVATRSAMTLRQYTFAAWVKAYGDTYGSQRIIIAYDPTTGSKGIFAGYLGTGDSHFMVTAAENVFPNSTVSAQDTENWHHVASTFDGRRILLYFDGVLGYSKEIAFSSVDYTMKLGIGNEDDPTRYPTHSYHWNGAIDEVYVFDRALSADEVVALKDGSWAAVNALNPENDLSIAAGAALDLGGTEQTVATLTLNGRLRKFGQTTWGAIGSGARHETELITGSGILHVSGPTQTGLTLIVK